MPLHKQLFACVYKGNINMKSDRFGTFQLVLNALLAAAFIYLLEETTVAIIGLIYLGGTFGSIYRFVVSDLLLEKQNRNKLLMQMNGMHVGWYHMGYYILAILKSVALGGIICIGLIPKEPMIVWLEFFLAYMLGAMAMTSFAMFFTTFFQNEDDNLLISIIFNLLGVIFIFAMNSSNIYIHLLICLFPASAFSYAIGMLHFGTVLTSGFTVNTAYLTLIVLTFFYYGLYVLLNLNDARRFKFKHLFQKKEQLPPPRARRAKRTQISTDLILPVDLKKPLIELKLLQGESQIEPSEHHHNDHRREDRAKFLEVLRLNKTMDNTKVVDEISFRVYENDIYCIIMNNPATKTALINCITGIDEPDSGKVLYNGISVMKDPDDAHECFGVYLENSANFSYMTVYEHLRFFSMLKGVEKEAIEDEIEYLLDKLQLKELKDKYPEQLTDFDARKLSFAFALCSDPCVVVLDQPTSNLNIKHRQLFWDIIKSLKSKGTSVLVFTHNTSEAEELAHSIAIVDEGKVVCKGPPEYIRNTYSVGYDLVINFESEASNAALSEIRRNVVKEVEEVVGKAIVANETKNILHLLLPKDKQHLFGQLFERLERYPQVSLNLESFSLASIITKIECKMNLNRMQSRIESYYGRAPSFKEPEVFDKPPKIDFMLQLKAILMRKWIILKRRNDKKLWIFFPILYQTMRGFTWGWPTQTDRISLDLMSSLTFGIGTYSYSIVIERKRKLKQLMMIMGCRRMPYWLGNLVFDTITAIAFSGIFCSIASFIHYPFIPNYPIQMFIFISFFMINLILVAYCWSYVYIDPDMAERSLGGLVWLVMIPIPFLLSFTKIFEYLPSYIDIRYPFYFLSPIQSFYDGLSCLIDGPEQYKLPFKSHWHYIGLMAISGALYFCFVVFYLDPTDWKLFVKAPENLSQVDNTNMDPIKRNEVLINQEISRCNEPGNTDLILAKNLKLVFPNGRVAVDGVTFGVQRQEILAIVGPGRSGKSTLLEMLGGLTPRNSGVLKLFGISIYEESYDIFKFIGISTQGHSVWLYLTIEEQLKLFGMLKGLSGDDLKTDVDYIIDTLELRSVAKTPVRYLNMTYRRILSLGISLIGGPSILLLDEPGAGLNSSARRRLWDLLRHLAVDRGAAIVYMTSNIQEAVEVCNRMAIMVNGSFIWVDSFSNLEKKYHNTYNIVVEKISPTAEPILPLLQELIPDLKIREDDRSVIESYRTVDLTVSFSKIFSFLEELKEKGRIKDFNLSAGSLEQSYLYVSRFQT